MSPISDHVDSTGKPHPLLVASDGSVIINTALPAGSNIIGKVQVDGSVPVTGLLSETPHVLLDGTINSDTLAGSVVRGDIIGGNSTPKWARIAKGSAGDIVSYDANDVKAQSLVTLLGYILTANGDILFRDHSSNIVKLAKGAIGTVLTEDANQDPSWAAAASAAANGSAYFVPPQLQVKGDLQGAYTANRIYICRITLDVQIKVTGFAQCTGSPSTAAHYGAGLYDTAGALLCSGVSGSIGTNAKINIACGSATVIPPGVYLMAFTADATGQVRNYLVYADLIVEAMNQTVVTFGYTATASAAGVLPANINTALTAINLQGGPHCTCFIQTVNW